MNIIAFFIGCAIAAIIVVRFREKDLERKRMPYPLLLATFPFYYFAFALYAKDYSALVNEILVGIIFVFIALFAYMQRSILGMRVLGLGYIAHAIYDVIHSTLFFNSGTPLWWPEFCGAVDGLLGIYLLCLAQSTQREKKNA